MSKIPVATELGRRDRLWPAVTASIAVHAVAIVFALQATSGPELDLEQTPLKAKLVRLGEKKPEAQLPRKDVAPAPPEPAPAAPAPPATPPPTPDTPPPPTAMPAPQPAPTPAVKAPARPAPARNRANGAGVDALLARTERELNQEKLYGDPEGSAFGNSDEGSPEASYAASVVTAIMQSYDVPATSPVRERERLAGVIRLWIEPSGKIRAFKITRSSGNPTLDAAIERAVRATTLLETPPKAAQDRYRVAGLEIPFDAKQN